MTALIADVQPTRASIFTDTLSSTDHGGPCSFATKVYVLPHLRMVFACVGKVAVGDQWFLFLNGWLGHDILEIDKIAPDRLRQIWRWQKHRRGSVRTGDVTHILHFGFPVDPSGESVRVFQYHSGADFISHPGTYGLLTIPDVTPSMPSPSQNPLQCLIEAMRAQREQFRAGGQPHAVGGEIQLVEVHPTSITSRIVYRFDDFDETLAKVRNRVAQEAELIAKKPAWLQKVLRRSGRIP